MPQLPSGRHIAILTDPLRALIDDAQLGLRIPELWAIRTLAELWMYIDIVWLVPGDDAQRPSELRHSASVPAHLIPQSSGHTVDQLEDLWSDWPPADQDAFSEFIEGRGSQMGQHLLDVVEGVRQRLLADPLSARGNIATMLKLGIHPSQDPPEDESSLP